ncbi:stage III sporulation protein AE [Saliterribacillus persicus]|uniref:Stage III sporulation protein AE n=1 Tax=Saliterribacillus persicus TaxID=930114 RepID=A0A368XBR4_9BACI|nr:stage III sporulation protein AE [Saliterribacillus persicus]RCW65403.1 stage III sporulation protein AE [Saliterribacillus persicus]
MRIPSLKVILFLILIFFGQLLMNPLLASEKQEISNQIYDSTLQSSEVEKFWEKINQQYETMLPDLRNKNFSEIVKGNNSWSIEEFFFSIVKYFFYELINNSKILGILILLTLFSQLLQIVQGAFEQQTVSKVAYFIIYIFLFGFALNSFQLTANYVDDTMQLIQNFMIALLPLLLGMLASLGNVVSQSFFHPLVIFLINMSIFLVSKVVIPLFFLSAILNLVSTLHPQYNASKLADLLKNISFTLIGIFFSVFIGIMSVQGTASAIQDGVAMKTAKFVTGNFVPVIGKMFTEATETVISASILIKNGLGIAGLVMLLIIVLFPALKILAIGLIYKLAAVLLQPIGDGPVIASLDIIGKHILYLFVALLLISFMFFITITIIVLTSNITLMIR